MWNPFLQITLFGFGLLSSFSGFFDDVSSAKPFCVFISANIQKCWSGRVMKHYLMNIYAPGECVLEIFINIFTGTAALLCLQVREHEKLCNHCCLSPLHPPALRKRTLHTSQRKSAWKKLYSSFIHAFYLFRLRFSTSYVQSKARNSCNWLR